MARNITLSVPDDLGSRMEKRAEVNWSAVARECIEKYLVSREKPDLTAIIETLRKEKGKEYAAGVSFADLTIKRAGYSKLAATWRVFQKEIEKLDREKILTGQYITNEETDEQDPIVREP